MNFLTAMAAIGGFLFGYDTGVISGAMLPIQRQFNLTPTQEEAVVTSTVLSAFIFSLIGGSLNNKLGRRLSILFASFVFTIGSLLLAFAWDVKSLIFGRLIIGVGIGVASLTTPVYISEMAKPSLRGTLVTMNALLIPFGQFFAGMVDGILSSTPHGWRYMLGLAAVPSVVMLFGFLILPESPRWLASKGRYQEAKRILEEYRDTRREARQEIQEIIGSLQQDNQSGLRMNHTSDCLEYDMEDIDSPHEKSFFERLRLMIDDAPTRRAMCVGCGIMLFQQLCGINTVMYYAASIFKMSGNFSETASIWLSGFTALAQVFGVALSIFFVERAGRRQLVLFSLGSVTLCLAALSVAFYCDRVSSASVTYATDECSMQPAVVWSGKTQYCYDCMEIPGCAYFSGPNGVGICSSRTSSYPLSEGYTHYTDSCPALPSARLSGYASVVFMFLYLLFFGIGMGGLPWTINSEIYPLRHRSMAVSLSTATNWLSNIVVSASFLSISSPASLTVYGAFWMYGCVAFLGFIFVYCTLPETKGLSLEEIELLFQKRSRIDPCQFFSSDKYESEILQPIATNTERV